MNKLILRATLVATLGCVCLSAQNNVVVSNHNQDAAETTIIHYTANVADYICKAKSTQDISTISVSTVSNANPGVATATAHGLYFATGVTQKVLVFVSGATTGWTGINGFHVITPTSANAFSFDVDTSGYGSFAGQTIVVSTRAPKATASVWSVNPIVSDGSGNPTILAWAVVVPTSGTLANLTGGQTGYRFPCALPTSYE